MAVIWFFRVVSSCVTGSSWASASAARVARAALAVSVSASVFLTMSRALLASSDVFSASRRSFFSFLASFQKKVAWVSTWFSMSCRAE